MNDRYPDELPAEDELPECCEPWWWAEMTTAPLDEGEAEVEQGEEERDDIILSWL